MPEDEPIYADTVFLCLKKFNPETLVRPLCSVFSCALG